MPDADVVQLGAFSNTCPADNDIPTNTHTAVAIECFVCNATDSASPFQCGEWFERFDTPDIRPQSCAGVHGAKYCVKHIGRFEGTSLDNGPVWFGHAHGNARLG